MQQHELNFRLRRAPTAFICVLQAKALMDLQKRFVQQERQLQAATASAAASNTSEGADVEPYFPQERVQQELDMLHKVRMYSQDHSVVLISCVQLADPRLQHSSGAQYCSMRTASQVDLLSVWGGCAGLRALLCLHVMTVGGAACECCVLPCLCCQVEAQIDEVSTAAAVATAALPQLTREQQAAQVRKKQQAAGKHNDCGALV